MPNPPSADTTSFMARMEPMLADMLGRLAATDFRADPIGGVKYSRATSIISSAYKRHGQLLGHAILERLKDCHRFQVWTEDRFKLSHASAAELAKAFPPAAYRKIEMPYGDEERSIPVDLMVYDQTRKIIRAYNVKRGNGAYDAGKRRLILGELVRTQMLLASYSASHGLDTVEAEAYVIFYYGVQSIPQPYSLVADDLDAHFEFAVRDAVELVNNRLSNALHAMIEAAPSD
jgi:hypothetical protein